MMVLEGVRKSYMVGEVKVEVLRGIDLKIEKGEYVAILGPSGAGKSTLMHILGLLDVPDEGKYFFSGIETENLSDKELSRIRNEEIGFVFQAFHLIPHYTILENVLLPFRYRRNRNSFNGKEKALELIEKMGLLSRINHRANELSGGERQRVAIARALVNDPKVILADEPTGNLDTKTSNEIMDIFDELNEGGKTIVIVTHDPDVASRAKRRIVIIDGKIESDTG